MKKYDVTYKTREHKEVKRKSSYKNVQQLLDFLYENQQYAYAGYIEFKDGNIRIFGVQSSKHLENVFAHQAKRAFFIGRGHDTWNGICNFGNIEMLNPDDTENELLNVLPKLNV